MENITVSINVEVTIPAETWTTNYGIEGEEAIREDVTEYVENALHDALVNSLALRDSQVRVDTSAGA